MKRISPLLIYLVLLWSCATEGPALRQEPGAMTNNGTLTSPQEPSAEELFEKASVMLALPDGIAANSQKAREILVHLIQSYPDSKWHNPASALMLLIDRQAACEKKISGNRGGCEEIISQRLKCEGSETQCRQEITRLLQENEQLKQDLENLKKLEIELEQRNRTLR